MTPLLHRRLDALEARSTRKARVFLFLMDPDEPLADAWARSRPGEPFDPNAEITCISWMRAEGDHGG